MDVIDFIIKSLKKLKILFYEYFDNLFSLKYLLYINVFFPTLTVVLTDDQMIKSQQQIMSFGRSLYIDGIFPPNRSLIYIIIGLKSEYSKKFNR